MCKLGRWGVLVVETVGGVGEDNRVGGGGPGAGISSRLHFSPSGNRPGYQDVSTVLQMHHLV